MDLISVLLIVAIWFIFIHFTIKLVLQNSSGWRHLEPKYKTKNTQAELDGRNLKIRNCNLGEIRIKNLLNFYDTQYGLLIKQKWFCKGSEYNLLIPWKEIVAYQEKKILLGKIYRLTIGQPEVSYLELHKSDFKKIENRIKKIIPT